MRAFALKTLIREQGCELSRIGRSRNWQLKANKEQLIKVIDELEKTTEPSWQWVAPKLRQHVDYTTFESLLQIAKTKPGITVNELMAKTDCTIQQARKVIDELEFLD